MENIMEQYIANQVEESYKVKKSIYDDLDLMKQIEDVSKKTIEIYKNGNKTLIAGNGGSAADAQHMAGEFVSKFYFDRPGLASIALTTDTSIITAIGNDYGYEKLFSRQIQANGVSGDIFIGISTSGNSVNIIEALNECKEKGIITVGLTGQSGGKMNKLCDYCIKVPSAETPRVQEAHILIGHIICAVVEEELFGRGFS
jgi:D-sedoheptulose 7-phosphate isomerase